MPLPRSTKALAIGALEALAVVAALYPLTVLGRLTLTVTTDSEIDSLLQRHQVYQQVTWFMENMVAKAAIGMFLIVIVLVFAGLAELGHRKPSERRVVWKTLVAPRHVLRFSVPLVLGVFAFLAGAYYEPQGRFLLALAFQFLLAWLFYSLAAKWAYYREPNDG